MYVNMCECWYVCVCVSLGHCLYCLRTPRKNAAGVPRTAAAVAMARIAVGRMTSVQHRRASSPKSDRNLKLPRAHRPYTLTKHAHTHIHTLV